MCALGTLMPAFLLLPVVLITIVGCATDYYDEYAGRRLPTDLCWKKEIVSAGMVQLLNQNATLGVYPVPERVVAIDTPGAVNRQWLASAIIAAPSQFNISATIACHVTLTFSNSTRQSGTILADPPAAEWISDQVLTAWLVKRGVLPPGSGLPMK
jgi:hypothetical protein